MNKHSMTRRRFLQTSGVIVGVAALGGATLTVPRTGWSAELEVLSAPDAETLLEIVRQIFPHDSLADMYYAFVVRDLDEAASDDPAVSTLLQEGIAALDGAIPGARWLELSAGNRQNTLQAIRDGAFFGKVQGTAVVSLYNNSLAWRHFGYEGASYPFGGYIDRGFNDLTWLPEPPEEASPKAG